MRAPLWVGRLQLWISEPTPAHLPLSSRLREKRAHFASALFPLRMVGIDRAAERGETRPRAQEPWATTPQQPERRRRIPRLLLMAIEINFALLAFSFVSCCGERADQKINLPDGKWIERVCVLFHQRDLILSLGAREITRSDMGWKLPPSGNTRQMSWKLDYELH